MSSQQRLLPRFDIGDRVIRSSNTPVPGCEQPLIFRGIVTKIYSIKNYYRMVNTVYGITVSQKRHDQLVARDSDYKKFPIYQVEPDSSPGKATFEEAALIVPGLTRIQYDMLMDRRVFDCIDSDLLPEDMFHE